MSIFAKIMAFIAAAMVQGTPLLFGATGEIITEKSGNLNLGIPGIMYIGGISGIIGGYLYEHFCAEPVPILCVVISFLASIIGSTFIAFIYSFLTITLKANQNVVGLALTTLGVGLGNFYGGSLLKFFGENGSISLYVTGNAYRAKIPFLSDHLGIVGETTGAWTNNGFGDRGWLAIAIVIFALWKPKSAIFSSYIFGGLYIASVFISGLSGSTKELIKMLPYLVTIAVLVFTSSRKKREHQPPAALGQSYFREER